MNETKTVFTFLFPLSEKEKNSLVKNTKTNNTKPINKNNNSQEWLAFERFVNAYDTYYRNFSSRNVSLADLTSFLNLSAENERLIEEALNSYVPSGNVRQKYLSTLYAQKELIEKDIEKIKELDNKKAEQKQKSEKYTTIYKDYLESATKLEKYKNEYRDFNGKSINTYERLRQECNALIDEFNKLETRFNEISDFGDAGKLATDCITFIEWLGASFSEIEKKKIITSSSNSNTRAGVNNRDSKLEDYDTVVANRGFKRISTVVTGAFIIGIIILVIKLFIG